MERTAGTLWLLFGLWILVARQGEAVHLNDNGQARTYIVHVDHSLTHGRLETPLTIYSQLLQAVKQDSATLPLHVYSSACHGFSAHLAPEEAEALRKMTGVLAVYSDSKVSLLTTRTPEFLGLSTLRGLWPEGHFGEDVIIGMIDGGVWPESDSFSDEGLGPVPARWKGVCETGANFTAAHCNRKLIGARYYYAGYEKQFFPLNFSAVFKSTRDDSGHGSHTASTAAGSPVPGASVFGLANGTARGMAPKARIAMYKVCWTNGDCSQADTMAAIDQAVADGVDVISLSIGDPVVPLTQDPLAIGAFGAMRKGVFVSCAGGNSGPGSASIMNIPPWVVTVAATSLDRSFPANVELGDGQILHGQSVYDGSGGAQSSTPLITGADGALNDTTMAAMCVDGSLDPTLVKGKIVVCQVGGNDRREKGWVVLAAGGAGMIIMKPQGEGVLADAHVLPATFIGAKDGATLLSYMNSTQDPVGKFQYLGTEYDVRPAPVVAYFSSRGPNPQTPQVLKPDIAAPGVNILAAWPSTVGPSLLEQDTRRVKFNSVSGTSMACPHVSGLGALLRGAHPEWSPSAIKSAMMTTASPLDRSGGVITDAYTLAEGSPFLYGSGHVQPQNALDPGLVYDMGPQDYVNFLCSSNFSSQEIMIFTHNETIYSCPEERVRIEDMNYPSFSAVFKQAPSLLNVTMNMTRTVTNVGSANATFEAHVVAPSGTQVTVHPEVLRFAAKNEKQTFTVEVTTVNTPDPALAGTPVTEFAFLAWTDGQHVVQSPIAITVHK